MLHQSPALKNIARLLADKREEKAQGEYIATLMRLYRDEGRRSGCGSCVAAFDDHFGAKRNPNAETQLPIEREILREILKQAPTEARCETSLSANTRLQDQGCVPKLESHLRTIEEKHEAHHRQKAALCEKLHHLRTGRPQKPHNFHEPHTREEHCRAVHAHAQAEYDLHQQIAQLGPCEQIH